MSNTICICCAGRMKVPSPRNPNVCLSCEQLLEDDCNALEHLLAEPEPAAFTRRNMPVEEQEAVKAGA
jgi:hypothetical protein